MSLFKVPALSIIMERLPKIFPEGTQNRNYLIREMAAKTIFVMFYAGAIEGEGRWIRPNQVVNMGDTQTAKIDEVDRLLWIENSLKSKKKDYSLLMLGTLRILVSLFVTRPSRMVSFHVGLF